MAELSVDVISPSQAHVDVGPTHSPKQKGRRVGPTTEYMPKVTAESTIRYRDTQMDNSLNSVSHPHTPGQED